jgi:hypothetical protein
MRRCFPFLFEVNPEVVVEQPLVATTDFDSNIFTYYVKVPADKLLELSLIKNAAKRSLSFNKLIYTGVFDKDLTHCGAALNGSENEDKILEVSITPLLKANLVQTKSGLKVSDRLALNQIAGQYEFVSIQVWTRHHEQEGVAPRIFGNFNDYLAYQREHVAEELQRIAAIGL